MSKRCKLFLINGNCTVCNERSIRRNQSLRPQTATSSAALLHHNPQRRKEGTVYAAA